MLIFDLIKRKLSKKTEPSIFLYNLPFLVGPPEPVTLFQTRNPSTYTNLVDNVETYSGSCEYFPWVARSLITGKDYCFPKNFNRANVIRLFQSVGYSESYVTLNGDIKSVLH